MKKVFFVFLCFIICQDIILSQNSNIHTTAQIIKPNRYYDFNGSPYYFKNWVKAKLIEKNGGSVEEAMINFNGYTQNFEVQIEDEAKILNASHYYSIVVSKEENENEKAFRNADKLIFRQGFHEKFLNKFAHVVYEGEKFTFLKEMYTELIQTEKVSIGEIQKIQKFASHEQYYLLAKGKLVFPIKNKNSQVIRVLGDPETLNIKQLKGNPAGEEEKREFNKFIEDNGGYVISNGDLLYEENKYFIGIENDLLFPIELNKKYIFEVIGETHLNNVKKYLKEKDNKLNSEQQIVEFLKYYETNFME